MFMWQGVLKGKTSEEFWFWNVCVRGGICRNGKCNLTDPVRPDGCTYRFSQQGQDGGGAISIFFCHAKNWGKHQTSIICNVTSSQAASTLSSSTCQHVHTNHSASLLVFTLSGLEECGSRAPLVRVTPGPSWWRSVCTLGLHRTTLWSDLLQVTMKSHEYT